MKFDTTSVTIRLIRVCVVIFAAAAVMLIVPRTSHAMTLVAPEQGVKLPWVQLRPPVSFDIAEKEKPKWALIATDAEMTKTVRYCRTFGSQWVNNGWHWACDAWAVGTDPYGMDIVRGLDNGKVYYWQVVYTDAAGVEQKSEVRAFSVEAMPTIDIASLSDQIFGSAVGDGTNLNLGAAAFVNSGVKVNTVKSARIKAARFQIGTTYTGNVDLSRSFVRITSKAGTRILPLVARGNNAAIARWSLTRREWKLKNRVYRYQVYLRSAKNSSQVRSEVRVLVIKRKKSHPAWHRTA